MVYAHDKVLIREQPVEIYPSVNRKSNKMTIQSFILYRIRVCEIVIISPSETGGPGVLSVRQ